jgi:hypothetical protein
MTSQTLGDIIFRAWEIDPEVDPPDDLLDEFENIAEEYEE